jgi:hypothetical protein
MKKPIKNYENLYEITDEGKIICLPRTKYNKYGSFKTKYHETYGYKNKKGYMVINLTSDDKNIKRKNTLIHRLVAEAFIPNPRNYPYINHKDGDKANNNVNNLEWCNNSMNQLHAFANGLQKGGCDHNNSKLKYEDVLFIKKNHTKFKQIELANMFNISRKAIYQILKGITYKNVK